MILRTHSKSSVNCWALNWSCSANWSAGLICSGNTIWSKNWFNNWPFTWDWSRGRRCSSHWSRNI